MTSTGSGIPEFPVMADATCGRGWDKRCRTATGGVCRCQCGGANHGKDAGSGREPSLFGAEGKAPADAGQPRAVFSTIYADSNVVVIVDENGARSVTNDAERVVTTLRDMHGPKKRILYLDSERNLDELCDTDGRFVGFRHVLSRSIVRAIASTPLDD